MQPQKTYLRHEKKYNYLDDYYITAREGENISTKMDENTTNYIRMDNLYTLQLYRNHTIYIVKPLGSICKKSYGSFYNTGFYTESVKVIAQYDVETFVNTVPRQVQKILLERNGWLLPLIRNWTKKMAKIALSNSPDTILELKDADEKLIKLALNNHPTLACRLGKVWIKYGIEVLKKWMERDKKNAKYLKPFLDVLINFN